ncbi:MAG TPA: hypothetical protein PL077_04690 [Treponemataceae bacterium]|nr:hypothetical protein [Treponemataceae bacterium]
MKINRAAQIAAALKITEALIERAATGFPVEESRSSRDRWTLRDVLHHISEWIDYSHSRLRAILDGGDIVEVGDLESFNRAAWDRGAALSRVEAGAACIAALKKYALLLREFPESDFERKDLPTGFSFELWRYMLLDSLVHPVQHLLYHAATRGDFSFARFALHEAGETLLAFSGGKADSFDLFEFASDPAELREAVFAFGAACPGDEYARVLVQRHCGSLYPALRRQFSLSFAMLRNLVEHSPAAVWDEKAGGFVYWQQLLHALSGVSCWLRRGDEPFREPFAEKRLYPELDGEPESMLTREELLLFLEEADETAGRFVFGGNDAWLAEKPVADSRYTNLELLGMQIRHVMYHVGHCESILRERGFPTGAWED